MDNPRDSELLPGASVNNSRAFFLPVSNRAVYVRTSFPLLWAILTGKLIFCNPWEYPLLSPFASKIYTAFLQDEGVQTALLRNHECSTWLLSTLRIIRARLWPGLRGWGQRDYHLSGGWSMKARKANVNLQRKHAPFVRFPSSETDYEEPHTCR